MSEKKRFEWIDKDTISDNQTNEWYCFLFDDIRDDFVDLLNEEQTRIRELEEEKMELEKKLEFKTLKQEEKDKQIEEDYARLQRRKILERSGNCEPLTLKYNPNTTYRI